MKNTLRALLACALLLLTGAASAQAQEVKVLVFSGPQDATTTAGVNTLKAIGTENGFTVDSTAAATDINTGKLQGYRALVFLNTAGNLLNASQEAAVQQFVEAGNGFVGIGSAAQGESGAFFDGLIGARPAATSSTAETAKLVVPGDRVHPSTRALPLKWNRTDAWYQWAGRVTGSVHVVARYRAPGAPSGDATKETGDNDTPISWCRDYSGGRSFYTGMGRTAAAYGEADFKAHLLGALEWTTGVERGDCKATINANYKGTKIMSAGAESTGLATSGESHGLAVADNGWVFYIGRADCRTDAERGALYAAGAPFGRIFDHSNPRVGVGCGSVHIYDPSAATGALNSGITLSGKLAVYGDGGQGGERTDQADHKMEYGLIGVAPDPKFSENGWIYLQYFPTFDPTSTPPGLPVERRVSKMSRPRISRFTVNRQTKKLDLASEKRIFEYDAQIYSCCHVGGGMGFDSKGNLYVTTGDTNSSQGSGAGYSGNNPTAKCPIGDNSVPSSANCGTANYSYQDARRTAGNTNDYNGKMLRFNPLEIPDSTAQPAVGPGTTYSLPTSADPNGPNLFDGTEGGGGKARPEIYAMGLRNPSRLSIDPETDVPYTAWVGPDAGEPDATLGPSTYENAAQISRAGNYGWPYCMGNKQGYRDKLADGTLRTTNAPGYVTGGPAGAPTNGWYDCDNLHNDSPNNTGLVELPHQTGTGADAGKVRGNNLWYSRGNKGSANGCPEFPRPTGGAPDYSAQPVELCPYARNDGMTIMDGPVYRYKAGADNSKRWPEYWDGRWFLHNNGGPSIKHGLLMDPETDQDGGLPIYADSLRDTLSWDDGSYMDSKFGQDGALYVQTYDGFFRAGTKVSIYRYDYTGGPATPVAAPDALPIGGYEVRFSIGASGGVSYKWEFGDGATSTEANPIHKYAEEKQYTAKLTVTYKDGSTDTDTIDVNVLAKPDETAPSSTSEVDADADGELGWYSESPQVTLTATDGQGAGVERITYTVDGGAEQTYSGPFAVQGDGAHEIRYFATDRVGNAEAANTRTVRVDGTAPTTTATTKLDDQENGPATVTLDSDDGKGSGAVLTEYRVDGGAWKVYSAKDEHIFDGTDASLATWKQAPSGHFDLMTDGSGGITPVGGLGMLWYPKPYGDFRLKLQFREGRTDNGYSNGGVFVRFPNPEQDPRTDECAKQAGGDDAWVAIYCGHEIQLFDDPSDTRESRKTGSIYTFDNNGITQIGPTKPRGEWEDYEIEVRGQQYTIRRNGVVIKQFANEPGKQSDRGGDPPTDLRQFAEGYIGLQNHGGDDTMQYRNIHVEDLSEGAPGVVEAKPFQVTGKGPHTIEVRSKDAAGNVEAKHSMDFRIGSATPPDAGTPLPATPSPTPGTPAPVATPLPELIDFPATYRLGSVTSKVSRATFTKKGIKIPVQCTGAMTGSAKITVSSADRKRLKLAKATIDSEDVTCYGPHTATVTLKPSSAIAKRLARKGGPKSVKLSVTVTMRDWGKAPTTTKKTITLRR